MNIDPSKAVGNGSVTSSSVSSSHKSYLANGGLDRAYTSLSNDLSFPPGGVSSLRLPVVVVLNWSYIISCRDMIVQIVMCMLIYIHTGIRTSASLNYPISVLPKLTWPCYGSHLITKRHVRGVFFLGCGAGTKKSYTTHASTRTHIHV